MDVESSLLDQDDDLFIEDDAEIVNLWSFSWKILTSLSFLASLFNILCSVGYVVLNYSRAFEDTHVFATDLFYFIIAAGFLLDALFYLWTWQGSFPGPLRVSIWGEYLNVIGSIGYVITSFLYISESDPNDSTVVAIVLWVEGCMVFIFVIDSILYMMSWIEYHRLESKTWYLHLYPWDMEMWANLLNVSSSLIYLIGTSVGMYLYYTTGETDDSSTPPSVSLLKISSPTLQAVARVNVWGDLGYLISAFCYFGAWVKELFIETQQKQMRMKIRNERRKQREKMMPSREVSNVQLPITPSSEPVSSPSTGNVSKPPAMQTNANHNSAPIHKYEYSFTDWLFSKTRPQILKMPEYTDDELELVLAGVPQSSLARNDRRVGNSRVMLPPGSPEMGPLRGDDHDEIRSVRSRQSHQHEHSMLGDSLLSNEENGYDVLEAIFTCAHCCGSHENDEQFLEQGELHFFENDFEDAGTTFNYEENIQAPNDPGK
jgi:hypothetical protein